MHLVTLVVRALLWLKTLGSMIGSTLAFYCFCNKLCKFISWKQNKTITSQFLSANWVLYLGWNRDMSWGWCLLLESSSKPTGCWQNSVPSHTFHTDPFISTSTSCASYLSDFFGPELGEGGALFSRAHVTTLGQTREFRVIFHLKVRWLVT